MPVQIIQSVSKPALYVLCAVLFSTGISAEDADGTLSTDAGLPAGTRLVIPQGILERYQAASTSWDLTYPDVYLFLNYFVTAPSRDDKRKETAYIPLSLGDGTNGVILWMDIRKVYRVDEERVVFRTRDDIKFSDLYR